MSEENITTLATTVVPRYNFHDESGSRDNFAVYQFAGVCAGIFCFLGTAGNILTAVAILKDRQLRRDTMSYFILSLCGSDCLFCLFDLPFYSARYINGVWNAGGGLCQFFAYTAHGIGSVSVLNVLALTINRYVCILHHTSYPRIYTPRNVFVMILTVWIVPLWFMIIPLLGFWGEFGYDFETHLCLLVPKDGKTPKAVAFLMFSFVPCVVMCFCYLGIFWRVRKSRMNLQAFSVSDNQQGTNALGFGREEVQLAKMILIVFADLLFCYMPLVFFNVSGYDKKSPAAYVFAKILVWSTLWTNLVIYGVYNRVYRQAYKNLLCSIKTQPFPAPT